jgi:hypothetical protein
VAARELLADPNVARLPHRVETNRHGHILEVLSSSNTPEEISEKVRLENRRVAKSPTE